VTKKVLIPALLTMTAVLASCGGSDLDPQADAGTSATTATPVRDGSGTARVPVPASHPHGVVEDCSTRSWAEFGGAFTNPANLVVGPLALVGAGRPTPAAVVTRFGGNKFPLLVRQGHIVTVQVPEGARGFAALGYGPLPQGSLEETRFHDGHDTVTFLACGPDEPSGSNADGPVTFWSGFVLVRKPSCVPLDVYVDDESAPRRVEIELGAPC
jgi:hypothetical protein